MKDDLEQIEEETKKKAKGREKKKKKPKMKISGKSVFRLQGIMKKKKI